MKKKIKNLNKMKTEKTFMIGTASEIATYVVDGSSISVEKGILQQHSNLALI